MLCQIQGTFAVEGPTFGRYPTVELTFPTPKGMMYWFSLSNVQSTYGDDRPLESVYVSLMGLGWAGASTNLLAKRTYFEEGQHNITHPADQPLTNTRLWFGRDLTYV